VGSLNTPAKQNKNFQVFRTLLFNMSLVKFVPTYASLKPSSFIRHEKDGRKVKLLTLSAPHSVFSQFGGDAVGGKAEVSYVIEVDDKAPDEQLANLTVARNYAPIGYQSSEELRGLLEKLRVRQSFSLAAVGDSAFDMRALAYVCGNAVATVTAGCEFRYTVDACTVGLLSPTWNVPSVTNLTVAAGLAETGSEFATLARLASFAGSRSITLMGDVIPPRTNKALAGLALGSFSLKLLCNILNAAQSCSCAGMHVEAFFCGMASFFRLRAHTDEGGLIRPILAQATYPKTVGVLTVGVSGFLGLSPRELLLDAHVPQVAIGLYLEFVGTLVTSDPGASNPTILTKDSKENKPSSFPGLRPAFYKTMSRFRAQVCKDYDLHPATVGDDYSHDAYFNADREDRHLSFDTIVPFYWVEPGPLTVAHREYDLPMSQGKRTDLRLSRAEVIQPSAGYTEVFGRVPVGSAMFMRTSTAHPRMEGYQYILSPRYRPENGLSCMEVIVDDRLGTTTAEALFTDATRVNVSDRRWITPHNPCPSPAEGMTCVPQAVRYVYRGLYAEPTASDWEKGVVASFTGPLYVKGGSDPEFVQYSCRHVSAANKRWLNSRGRYAPKHILDLAALPSNFSFTPPVLLQGVEALLRTEEEGVFEEQPIDDTPTVEVPETVPDPTPLVTEGPLTNLEPDPGTGRRIRIPDAEVETEEQVGGASR
jgi:hypothetical protein